MSEFFDARFDVYDKENREYVKRNCKMIAIIEPYRALTDREVIAYFNVDQDHKYFKLLHRPSRIRRVVFDKCVVPDNGKYLFEMTAESSLRVEGMDDQMIREFRNLVRSWYGSYSEDYAMRTINRIKRLAEEKRYRDMILSIHAVEQSKIQEVEDYKMEIYQIRPKVGFKEGRVNGILPQRAPVHPSKSQFMFNGEPITE